MIDTAVILATGSKAHQSELIYTRPRTMLPALGKPMVVRVMDRLHRIGIQKYIVVLGEMDGSIASYLTTKWLPDVTVEFVLKRDAQPLGRTLAGIAKEHQSPWLLASYNSFTHGNFPARLLKYHTMSPEDLILTGALSSLSTTKVHTYAHVPLPDSSEIGFSTSPRVAAEEVTSVTQTQQPKHQNLVLAGVLACGAKTVQYLAALSNEAQRKNTLTELIQSYIGTGNCTRIARTSWVLQVQSDEDLITLNHYLLDEKIDANILSELPYTVRIIQPVRIDPGVSVGQGAIIGPHVYLEQGASVGREAHLQNTIVLERATVAAKEQIRDAIVSTRGRIVLTRTGTAS